jgi:acyl-coenzyme A thioesterase PaaI-like protein
VLTVEFKINLTAPADGERLVATGRVKKPGRTLTICEFEVAARKGGKDTVCALGLETLICLAGKPDAPS